MTGTEEETENEENGELILSIENRRESFLYPVWLSRDSQCILGIHFSSNVSPSYFHVMPTFKIPQQLHGMGSQLINLF